MEKTLNGATPRLRLQLIRKINNLTQKKTAELCNISPRSLQRLEYGEMQMTTNIIYALCSVFKVAPTFFFTDYQLEYHTELPHEKIASPKILAESSNILEAILNTNIITKSTTEFPIIRTNPNKTKIPKALAMKCEFLNKSIDHIKNIKDIEQFCLNIHCMLENKNLIFCTPVSTNKSNLHNHFIISKVHSCKFEQFEISSLLLKTTLDLKELNFHINNRLMAEFKNLKSVILPSIMVEF